MFPRTEGGIWYRAARIGFAGPMVSGMEIGAADLDLIPEGGAVLVCNHACDADPAVLMRALPGQVGFLAAPFMGKLPIFRTLLRWSGSVAIGSERPQPWRDQVHALLARGGKLVVFPEGQRWLRAQDFDAGLAELYPGFAVFAHAARVPVVPMVIERSSFEVVPFKTSFIVRHLSGNPEELRETKRVLRYKRCVVRALEPIPTASFVDRPKEEAVPWLVDEVRTRMEGALDAALDGDRRPAAEGPRRRR